MTVAVAVPKTPNPIIADKLILILQKQKKKIINYLDSNVDKYGNIQSLNERLNQRFFKTLQKDYQENKETGKYVNMQANYYGSIGDEFEPVEYGLIYIDSLNKKILYCQDYSNLKTINHNFCLYSNGTALITDFEFTDLSNGLSETFSSLFRYNN